MDNNSDYSYKVLFGAFLLGFALVLLTVFTSCSKKVVNPSHPADPIYSKYKRPVPLPANQINSKYKDPVPLKPGQGK